MASWFQTFGDRALILGRRPRLRLALQLLAFAVLTGSLVYAVRDSWSDAEELLRTADPLSLALGLGAIAAYYLAFVVGWQLILRAMGIELDYRTALRAEMLSMLAKYIPGGVWTPAARVVAVRKVGVRNTPLVLGSIALEAGLSAIAGVAVFVLSLGTVSSRNAPVWPLAAFVLVLVVLLHPRVFSPLMTRIARRLGSGPIPRIRERVLLGLVAYYCLTWLLAGVALFFLARSVGNPPVSSIPYLGGVSAVGSDRRGAGRDRTVRAGRARGGDVQPAGRGHEPRSRAGHGRAQPAGDHRGRTGAADHHRHAAARGAASAR